MTPLFGARRRAEDFAVLVDAATARAPETRPDDAVGTAPETQSLLALVGSLRAAGAAEERATPRAEFSSALRERLLDEAGTVLAPVTPTSPPRRREHSAAAPGPSRGPRTRSRRERWLVAATALTIMVGGSAGMATAAQGALPGEGLYPVKRGIERAVVTLSVSAGGRGRDLLKQAEGRLDEVHGLLDAGPVQRALIPGTLDTFHEQAREGADLMLESYKSNDDPAAMTTLRSFAARSATAVATLADEAPAQTVPELADAAMLVRDLDTEASVECPTCDGLPAVQVPEVLLTSAGDGLPRTAVDIGAAGVETMDDSHPLPTDASGTETPGATTADGTTSDTGGTAGQTPGDGSATPGDAGGGGGATDPDLGTTDGPTAPDPTPSESPTTTPDEPTTSPPPVEPPPETPSPSPSPTEAGTSREQPGNGNGGGNGNGNGGGNGRGGTEGETDGSTSSLEPRSDASPTDEAQPDPGAEATPLL